MKPAQPHHGATKSTGWHVYGVGLAVCAVLTTAAYFISYEPALRWRADNSARQAQLIAQHQKAVKLSTSLAASKRQLAAVNQALTEAPLHLEDASRVNHRLERLTDLATESGLTVDEVRPGTTSDSAHYQSVPIKIAGSGPFPACVKFMHRLRETFPDTGVRGLESTNNNPGPLSPAVNFRFELVWYTAPAAAVASTDVAH